MNRLAPLAVLLTLAACDAAAPTAPQAPSGATGRYIVTLHPAAEGARMAVARVSADADATPDLVFSHALEGFAAELGEAQLAALRADPRVASIEPDRPAQLFTTQTNPLSWGLDRVDDANLPLDNTYVYNRTGAGVRAYILDTGINVNHLDVVGRAGYIPNLAGGNFVPDGAPDAADCHGHGSHVAGTLGGTYSGMAKGVTLLAGRVVDCAGNGLSSYAIAAMDWIAANGVKPAVVNMSLGYGDVPAVRTAASRLVAAGFVVVAAAGNGNALGVPQPACTQSPAGAATVITVGATTSSDGESSFSNYGECVDILAPGSNITSSNYLVTNGVNARSGTSMATPHVAGEAAKYLQTFPTASPGAVWKFLFERSVVGTITLHSASAGGGTPNRFLRATF